MFLASSLFVFRRAGFLGVSVPVAAFLFAFLAEELRPRLAVLVVVSDDVFAYDTLYVMPYFCFPAIRIFTL